MSEFRISEKELISVSLCDDKFCLTVDSDTKTPRDPFAEVYHPQVWCRVSIPASKILEFKKFIDKVVTEYEKPTSSSK